jgi:hypothetical protein
MIGKATKAQRWLDHVYGVYPADGDRIVTYFACTAQHPGLKINHALLMGGAPGIGKDSILSPLRVAVGGWNFAEVRPPDLFSNFNKWQRAVVLRINEMHDLGDENMFSLYERLKPVTAAPPETLRVNEKNLGEYHIPNAVKVIMTTNYLQNGIYLPADDRRHDVMWSPLKAEERADDAYFDAFHMWLLAEGNGHVAAYLREFSLAAFNPAAPPVKTEAFWSIVNANRSPTDSSVGDIILGMTAKAGGVSPVILTVQEIKEYAVDNRMNDVYEWLSDMKHRRHIPAALERAGYVEVPNVDATDRRWFMQGRKQSVYRFNEVSLRDAIATIEVRAAAAPKPTRSEQAGNVLPIRPKT